MSPGRHKRKTLIAGNLPRPLFSVKTSHEEGEKRRMVWLNQTSRTGTKLNINENIEEKSERGQKGAVRHLRANSVETGGGGNWKKPDKEKKKHYQTRNRVSQDKRREITNGWELFEACVRVKICGKP